MSGFGGLWSQYSLQLVLIFLLIVPIIVLLTIVLAASRGRWEGGWEAKLWSQSAGANSVVLLRQPAQCTLHTSTSRLFSAILILHLSPAVQ